MYEDKFKKKIKKLDSTLKYEGRILSVYQDKMQVGDNIAYWDMVRVGNAATIIPVLDDGSIVMVRQYRPTMEEYILELPAGKFNDGETDGRACAMRELEEETGYKGDIVEELICYYPTVAFCTEKIYIYLMKNLVKGETHFDEDEEKVVEICKPEDLKKAIFNKEIKDGKTIAGLMSYFMKNNI